jgi:exopolysaccharide production protein ExoY
MPGIHLVLSMDENYMQQNKEISFGTADFMSADFPKPQTKFIQWPLKRVLDMSVSVALIVLVFPLLVIAASAIWIESRGSPLFLQRRVGLLGREFTMLKLRTMRTGSEQPRPADGTLVKPQDDPRITRLGRVMRQSSIDELPQLFNVLAGQMSLVGPRPLMPHMLLGFPEFAAVRNLVRPGITGLWQIRDRANATHVRFMVKHDLEYIKRFSLWLDLQILLETVGCVLSRKGAR